MAEESSASAAYDSVKPDDILAVRDWINANREKLVEKLQIPDQTGAEKPEIVRIPAGDISYKTPAFAIALQQTQAILTQLLIDDDGTNEPILQEFDGLFQKIEPLTPVIRAHADIHAILGTNTELTQSPQEVLRDALSLKLKYAASAMTREPSLGEIPSFDIRNDPFNPVEPGFLKTLDALEAAMQAKNLAPNDIAERAKQVLIEKRDAGGTIFQDKEDITKILEEGSPAQQTAFTLHKGYLPQEEAKLVSLAMNYHQVTYALDEDTVNAIQAARNPAQAPAVDPANGKTEPPPTTEEPEKPQEDKQDNPDPKPETAPPPAEQPQQTEFDRLVQEAHPKAFRAMVMAAEGALGIEPKDGFYDGKTQQEIEGFVTGLFERYGKAYLQDGMRIHAAPPSNEPYEFDEEGNIYTLEAKDDQLVRGPKVGDIRQGIKTGDGKTRPHPATVALLARIWADTEEELRVQKTGNIEIAYREQEKTLREQLGKIGRMDLEESIRLQLGKTGADEKAFRDSQAGKALIEASPSGGDDLIFLLMLQESAKHTYNTGIQAREQEAGRIDAVFNLLHFMGTNEVYDPKKQADMQAGILVRDNIIALPAYNVLRHMKGGEHILTEMLYDEAIPGQKESVLAAFGDRKSVSREDVYAYVQKEFEDRAIATLTGRKDIENLTSEERGAALRDVSHAMSEGRFNPYEKDVELVFKALGRPGLQDSSARGMINRARSNLEVPSVEFALKSLTESERNEIIGMGARGLSGPVPEDLDAHSPEEKLRLLLNAPSLELQKNPAFERMMMNYHESSMGNFTWWRNGEIGTDDASTWNGRYGGPDEDQLLHIYMRYHWHEMDGTFGKETADLMRTSTGHMNYEVKLKDVLEKMDPEAQQKLRAGIDSLSRPSMYSYLMDLRRPHYRDLRNQKYVPTLKQISLNESFQNATDASSGVQENLTDEQTNAAEEEAGPESEESSEENNQENLDHVEESAADIETNIKITDNVEDHSIPTPFKGGMGVWAWKKANTPTAEMPSEASTTSQKRLTSSQDIIHTGEIIEPEKPATLGKGKPVIIEGEFTVEKVETFPADRPALTAPEDARTGHSVALSAHEGSSANLPVESKGGWAALREESAPKAQHTHGVPQLYQASDIPVPAEEASKISSVFRSAGKILRALPLIGAGIATAEVGYLISNTADLVDAGLIPGDARIALAAEYPVHIAQSGFDPTIIGGEAATWTAMSKIITAYDLDLATASMVSPDFLSKTLKSLTEDEYDISVRDLNLLKERYGTDRALQENYYAPLIEKHGLPETLNVDGHGELPLGVAIRLPGIADGLRSQHPQIKYLETVNKVAGHARELIIGAETYSDSKPGISSKTLEEIKENAQEITKPEHNHQHPKHNHQQPAIINM